jgi:ABC-2 type transport system ATP-binding protein
MVETVESVATAQALGVERPPSSDTVLRTVQLTKRYGKRLAVNGLNLEVRRGEIFGFLGPNGAGKTTTIRMLLGLIAPTSGHVEVLGHAVPRYGDAVLPRVGALVEQPALYPYMTGRDNLKAAAQVFGPVDDRRLDDVLEQVGLKGRDKDRAKTYSLGMKQRLGVGMALIRNPDLLVLDEPANGLDPAGIVEMRDLMRRLSADGKTIFVSSHVLGEVQQICTRVAIINLGRLVTESTVEDLTRGTGEFRVEVERPEEALQYVRMQPWGAKAHLDETGALLVTSPSGKGRDLSTALVQAGFPPDRLEDHSESLEQVFLRLTGSTPTGA